MASKYYAGNSHCNFCDNLKKRTLMVVYGGRAYCDFSCWDKYKQLHPVLDRRPDPNQEVPLLPDRRPAPLVIYIPPPEPEPAVKDMWWFYGQIMKQAGLSSVEAG